MRQTKAVGQTLDCPECGESNLTFKRQVENLTNPAPSAFTTRYEYFVRTGLRKKKSLAEMGVPRRAGKYVVFSCANCDSLYAGVVEYYD